MHDDTMSEYDKVMIRWTITGTAKNFGIPASDKRINCRFHILPIC